jgi:hypothetical protein
LLFDAFVINSLPLLKLGGSFTNPLSNPLDYQLRNHTPYRDMTKILEKIGHILLNGKNN